MLYEGAQQMNPWRAGTPGRALRNRQAVVRYWRPLCCFVYLGCLALAPFQVAAGQDLSSKPTVSLRLGGFYATPLAKDAVSSVGLDDAIPGERSNEIKLQQKPGPIATLAAHFPMRANTSIELSTSVGRSAIRGDDGLASWDAMTATIGNAIVGFGFWYRRAILLHGGVGLTKIFAEERGLFAKGNAIKPIIDLGASRAVMMGSRPIELDFRMQSHSFGTATLRDNGGSDGNVVRATVQIGTTLWQGGH